MEAPPQNRKERKKKNKLIAKEIRFVITRGEGGEGELKAGAQKVHTQLAVSTREVLCSLGTLVNSGVCCVGKVLSDGS